MSAQLYIVNPDLPQALQDLVRERDGVRDEAKSLRDEARGEWRMGNETTARRLETMAQARSRRQGDLTKAIQQEAREL